MLCYCVDRTLISNLLREPLQMLRFFCKHSHLFVPNRHHLLDHRQPYHYYCFSLCKWVLTLEFHSQGFTESYFYFCKFLLRIQIFYCFVRQIWNTRNVFHFLARCLVSVTAYVEPQNKTSFRLFTTLFVSFKKWCEETLIATQDWHKIMGL